MAHGPLFRPIFAGLRICREKLAYVLDSTASPVCILIPFIGWGTYIAGLIEQGYRAVGRPDDGYATLIAVIPFQYYAILTLIAVPLFALRGRDLGPMRLAQEKWQRDLQAEATAPGQSGAQPATTPASGSASDKQSVSLFAIPISVLLGLIAGLLTWFAYNDQLVAVHVRSTLFISYLAAAFACALIMWRQQGVAFNDTVTLFMKGAESMVYVCGILVLAWSLGSIIGLLGTGDYLAQLVEGRLPPYSIPAITFLLAAATSFATGSSWGTFAILMVIALPVADALDASMIYTVAAVLSGGLFGDHTSPISDTTLLASMGADCEHVDHVTTQLPYALIVGAISFCAYLVVAVLDTWWVLPIAVLILTAVIWLATTR